MAWIVGKIYQFYTEGCHLPNIKLRFSSLLFGQNYVWNEMKQQKNYVLPIVEELRLMKCFLDGEKMRLMLRLNFGKFEMR